MMRQGRGKAIASQSIGPSPYRELIIRAVMGEDEEMIQTVVLILMEAENAKAILRAKGYGGTGSAIDAMARLVPNDRFSE